MEHFGIAQWTDFVRGLGESSERTAMQQHLSHCESCGRLSDMLRRFHLVTIDDSAPEVPDELVRNALAIFTLRKPEKVMVANLIAWLVYDSFSSALPAGVRSQRGMTRVVLYEAGDFCIDLWLEYQNNRTLIGLVGQVVSQKDPAQRMAGLNMMLKSGRKILAQTNTNEHGEFQLEYQPGTNLRLHIMVGDDCIEVPWGELVSEDRQEQ